MTKAWLLTLTVSLLAGFGESNAEGFDPASEEYAVTAEMLDADHDDYDEGSVDLIGKAIFKYVELGGETSALSDTQKVCYGWLLRSL
jgi:hypothetical protein